MKAVDVFNTMHYPGHGCTQLMYTLPEYSSVQYTVHTVHCVRCITSAIGVHCWCTSPPVQREVQCTLYTHSVSYLGNGCTLLMCTSPPVAPPRDLNVLTHSVVFVFHTFTVPSDEALNNNSLIVPGVYTHSMETIYLSLVDLNYLVVKPCIWKYKNSDKLRKGTVSIINFLIALCIKVSILRSAKPIRRASVRKLFDSKLKKSWSGEGQSYLIIWCPSGENVTQFTYEVCPRNSWMERIFLTRKKILTFSFFITIYVFTYLTIFYLFHYWLENIIILVLNDM